VPPLFAYLCSVFFRLLSTAAQPSVAGTKSKDWVMLDAAELAPPAEYANTKPGEFRDADGSLQAYVGTIGTCHRPTGHT